MSKFFGGSDSDTTSSSSDESDDSQRQVKPTTRGFNAAILVSPLLYVNYRIFLSQNCFYRQFSDDEADDKRVVRSAKEKRYEILFNIIKSIRNSKKIKDFNKMLSSYEDLLKAYEKAKPVIAKEENGVTPRFYVR